MRSVLQEKLAEDGMLVRMVRDTAEGIAVHKAELSVSRGELEGLEAAATACSGDAEAFTLAYASYREALGVHNTNVTEFARNIQRYNQLVDEYNRLAAVFSFIQHNRLDRRMVFARIRNL